MAKKEFGYSSGKTIEMPPADQTHPYFSPSGDVKPQQPTAIASQPAASEMFPSAPVPDYVPQESIQEMQSQEDQSEQEEVKPQASLKQQVESDFDVEQDNDDVKSNFRNLRQEKIKAERERDALIAQIMQMQQQQYQTQPKQAPQEVQEEEFDFNIDDDALIEGKHAKKILAQMKRMESKLSQQQARSYEDVVQARIASEFPDFQKVVSTENIERLNYELPELAESIRDNKDLYKKAVAAYKAIKRTGIYEQNEEITVQKQKVNQNTFKPKPAASIAPQQGSSPLSKANAFASGLTEDLKAQLHKEMMQAIKGR